MFSFPNLRDLLYMIAEMSLCLLLAYGWGLWQHHSGYKEGQMDKKIAIQTVNMISPIVTNMVVGKYDTKVTYIHGANTTIMKEVPIYVTKEDDSKCSIPNSFVSLWDSTNQMRIPDNSEGVPTGASSVVLSDIAAQHAREAGIAARNEARIDAMREWLLEQQKVYNSK